jgi:PAS domain S-box-containing protein
MMAKSVGIALPGLPVGEMQDRIRSFDWSRTPIGPFESWSPALRTTVRNLLANRFPQLLWWGPDYISIYNDAYRPILGRKHPWGLGKPVRECWSEIWAVLKPLIDTPFEGGPATWMEDLALEIHRRGFMEETHFTVAYSSVPDDAVRGGIGGVLATVHEITDKVVGERRIIILRDLGTRPSEAKTAAEEACASAAATLARHPKDIPFALFYLAEEEGSCARLVAWAGFGDHAFPSPAVIDLDVEACQSRVWPLAEARRSEQLQVVEDLSRMLPAIPRGPWADPPHAAAVVPIRSLTGHQFSGFLVAGISSRLKFDEAYRSFLELATSQVATAIANARAYEEERRRSEALAAIDRAKTKFFSNVSHEFRTPLTLMLGPLEHVLAGAGNLREEDREQITIAHRNSLRLLKLVNSLLDFSRIEAGRVKAVYQPLDLAALTADLASNFRSAIEAAGLELAVDCAPLPQPVYVDREMWEKIVLNLLSNAYKFTLEGRIMVCTRLENGRAVVTVSDTGTGIPETELPHLFERFHRVEGARGRTYEGTGIGLALIQELVRLHGGAIDVKSRAGEGSTFMITLAFGRAHLPAEQVSESSPVSEMTAFRRDAFTREAISWLARPSDEIRGSAGRSFNAGPGERPRVLLADDNADMREYISHTLGDGYEVTAVADGAAALDAARKRRPEIVLADIMMPVLDGFGLLRELRADPALRDVPVMLVSARAGEEARTEGISAGADDYLTKPFNAKELVARVETILKLQRVRRESLEEIERSEDRFRAFVTATSDVIYRMNADWSEMRHLRGKDFIADTEDPGRTWLEKYIHPDDRPRVLAATQEAIREKKPFELEHQVIRLDGTRGWTFSRAIPRLDLNGEIVEWFGAARDITAEKEAQVQLRDAAERLRFLAESMPQKIFAASSDGAVSYLNQQWTEFAGASTEQILDGGWMQFLHPDDLEENTRAWRKSLESGEPFQSIHRLRRADGEFRWHLSRAVPMRDDSGKIHMWIGSDTDIHDQKRTEEELRRANQDLEQFAYSVSHDLQEPLRGIQIFSQLLVRYRENLDGTAREFLSNVTRSASRLEALLRDLLIYTQAGRPSEASAAETDASDALQAALSNLNGAIVDSGARISSDPLPAVAVVPTHLQQIFQNLVGNAIKYRQPGVAPVVRISARRGKGDWLFAVSDNGIGIEPEYQETIFGLFKRLHSSDEYAGTGMGLAICQRIVERYHGRIWVESGPGKGSRFFFTIPIGAANPRAVDPDR